MSEPVQAAVEVMQFQGLATNVDPTDRPPGLAVEQKNVTSQTPGELRIRRGIRKLTFKN